MMHRVMQNHFNNLNIDRVPSTDTAVQLVISINFKSACTFGQT